MLNIPLEKVLHDDVQVECVGLDGEDLPKEVDLQPHRKSVSMDLHGIHLCVLPHGCKVRSQHGIGRVSSEVCQFAQGETIVGRFVGGGFIVGAKELSAFIFDTLNIERADPSTSSKKF